MYKLPQINKKAKRDKTNFWSPQWVNLLSAPELQGDWTSQNIENYFIEADWALIKRKGYIDYFSNAVWKPIRMFEPFTNNIDVFSAWNEVFYYLKDADTITSAWTYWEITDTDFVWFADWDYFFFTNWTWKIQYLTFDYTTVNEISAITSTFIANWPTDYTITNVVWNLVTLNANPVNDELWEYAICNNTKAFWTMVLDSWTTYTTSYQNWTFNIWDTITFSDSYYLTSTTSVIWYFKSWISSSWDTISFDISQVLDIGKKYKINVWATDISQLNQDIKILWIWNTITISTTVPSVEYRTFNWWSVTIQWNYIDDWMWTKTAWLSNIQIFERINTTLISWQLESSPNKAKRLLVFSWDEGKRLFAWNTEADSSAIHYSNIDTVSTLWDVPYQTWVSSNEPLLKNDPWAFTSSELWALKDFVVKDKSIVALFEKWKRVFNIQISSFEVWGFATQIQKINTLSQRIDFWWERNPLNTWFWLFYVNESWVWLYYWLWAWWEPQEQNISRVLGKKLAKQINWTNSDIVFEITQWVILITCARNSSYNNLVIWYNPVTKWFWFITWWNIERFMKRWEDIYWSSSIDSKTFKLFEWNLDWVVKIVSKFKKEINVPLNSLNRLENTLIKWLDFNNWDSIICSFDIYNKKWVLIENYYNFYWTTTDQCYIKNRTHIREFTRLIFNIVDTNESENTINYIKLATSQIWENKSATTWKNKLFFLLDSDWNSILDSDWNKIITT